jgi:hypothetical protein
LEIVEQRQRELLSHFKDSENEIQRLINMLMVILTVRVRVGTSTQQWPFSSLGLFQSQELRKGWADHFCTD